MITKLSVNRFHLMRSAFRSLLEASRPTVPARARCRRPRGGTRSRQKGVAPFADILAHRSVVGMSQPYSISRLPKGRELVGFLPHGMARMTVEAKPKACMFSWNRPSLYRLSAFPGQPDRRSPVQPRSMVRVDPEQAQPTLMSISNRGLVPCRYGNRRVFLRCARPYGISAWRRPSRPAAVPGRSIRESAHHDLARTDRDGVDHREPDRALTRKPMSPVSPGGRTTCCAPSGHAR